MEETVLPNIPPIAAAESKFIVFKPNCTAYGVTASLNVTVAASPEPEISANIIC